MPDIIRAITLMVVAMFFFTIADLFVKLASGELPSEMVVAIMGVGTAVLFYGALRWQSVPVFSRANLHWTVALRASSEVIAGVGIVVALAFVPLATVTAIMQSQPLLVTAAGALFLGEKVGIRRFAAVIVGLVGVLFIIRPGMGDFDVYALLVIVGVIGMTMRDVVARVVPRHIPSLALAFYGAFCFALAGVSMVIYADSFVMPTGLSWVYCGMMILGGGAGAYFITDAMRLGEVSVVSPFRYVKIIFGMGAGVLFLGEHIDVMTMLGTMIVTIAGIYAFLRERHLLKQAMAAHQNDGHASKRVKASKKVKAS